MASSTPPTYTDSPLSLLSTLRFDTGKPQWLYPWLQLSIYQQAPRLKLTAGKSDFVGYYLASVECVEIHHRYEETLLFPVIDKAAGQKGLMDDAVHEHETFYGGLARIQKYLRGKGPDYAAAELLTMTDSRPCTTISNPSRRRLLLL
ncbi:hemerythrin hhe cation binding domain-containing protein [Apiospora saccharicola]